MTITRRGNTVKRYEVKSATQHPVAARASSQRRRASQSGLLALALLLATLSAAPEARPLFPIHANFRAPAPAEPPPQEGQGSHAEKAGPRDREEDPGGQRREEAPDGR
jgi:hypothetical protein